MSPQTSTLLRPGDVLGGFRVEDVIGIGGMAIVYRAEQLSLGRPVALKVLSGKLTADPIFRERFRREGTHAAALEHPHIVPVYDSGEQDGELYLAMRLVEGTNLAELIQTRGLTADQTVELLRPIAGALDTAHAAGLIHRDVKPQNVLITSDGHPYLADFGVAKGSNTYGLTATGGFVGSVNYASPEQIKGLTLTPASDVYALTAVLYQCLTGEVPYPRETDAGIMHAHLSEPPPTLPSAAGVDSEFHTVLARGMAKDPGARYGHAGDLMNAAALCVQRLPGDLRGAVPAFPTVQPELSGPPRITTGRAAETEVIVAERLAQIRGAVEETSADRRREPPAPEPAVEASPRRTPKALAAALSGSLLAIAAVAALLVSMHGGKAQPSTFAAGHLRLTGMTGWRKAGGAIEGLALAPSVTLHDDSTTIYAGRLTAPGSVAASAPAALISADGSPQSSTLVTLPLGRARRYVWPEARGPALVLTVASSSAGELALACTSSNAASETMLLSRCQAVARRARVLNAHVEYPGADPGVARWIAAALARRATPSTVAARTQLGSLPSRATAVRTVAADDESALRALGEPSSSSRYAAAIAAVASALRQEHAALELTATAASASKRSTYEAARRQVSSAGTALQRSLRALASLGFAVPTVRSLALAAAPAPRKRAVGTRGAQRAPTVTAAAPAYGGGSTAAPTQSSAPSNPQSGSGVIELGGVE
jgi:hypothetical protein